jgi:hypothetical protein
MTLDDAVKEMPEASPEGVKTYKDRYNDRPSLPCWTRGDQFEAIIEDEESGMVQRHQLPHQWRSPWD